MTCSAELEKDQITALGQRERGSSFLRLLKPLPSCAFQLKASKDLRGSPSTTSDGTVPWGDSGINCNAIFFFYTQVSEPRVPLLRESKQPESGFLSGEGNGPAHGKKLCRYDRIWGPKKSLHFSLLPHPTCSHLDQLRGI